MMNYDIEKGDLLWSQPVQPGLVTVMMPAYNAETYIREAIQSVLVQSYTRWELVIVDDGSTDRTAEIVGDFIDPRIKLIHQANGGEASARNAALAYMQGEFLAFLDSDDLFLPDHLETIIDLLSKTDQADGVYTDGYYIDQGGKRLQTLSSRRRGPFEGYIFEEVVYGSDVFGPPACVVLRTDLILRHELRFDKNIVIGPDWDFFTKFAAHGKFMYIDQITCLYRLHMSNISFQIDLENRALDHAKCRINAIKTKNFNNCSLRVRIGVFYDLLVNLLLDKPKKQLEITNFPEFTLLPKKVRAKLFRLMASKTIYYGKDHSKVKLWLSKSRQLNPLDWRSVLLSLTFQLNPKFLELLLRLRYSRQVDPRTIPPFADMKLGSKN